MRYSAIEIGNTGLWGVIDHGATFLELVAAGMTKDQAQSEAQLRNKHDAQNKARAS